MSIAFFDCFSGISGDMCLGALIDAGIPVKHLEQELSKLAISGYKLVTQQTIKNGIAATGVVIEQVEAGHQQRSLEDIAHLLEDSAFPEQIKEKSLAVFKRLSTAEAKIHAITPDNYHYHEFSAINAIIGIVGTITGLAYLGIEQVFASPLPLGTGFVVSKNGIFPVPAPTTLEILKKVPVYNSGIEGELVTPTGAALITELAESFGDLPLMAVSRVGYGAGQSDLPKPNLLRIIIGDSVLRTKENRNLSDRIQVIETNIDNMNPEFYNFLKNKLFDSGALDVFLTPIQMKKNRPGILLTVLCEPRQLESVVDLVLRETTSIGVRIREEHRIKARRRQITVNTPYGKVRVKYSTYHSLEGETQSYNVTPEYEDCQKIALATNIPLKIIYDIAKLSALEKLNLV